MTESTSSFGHFQLIEKLGEGTFGTVYRATGPSDFTGGSGICALKILQNAHDERGMKRLRNEAAALALIQHPAFPRFYASSMDPSPWVAMELLPGKSIEQLVRDPGSALGTSTAVPLLLQLMDALDYLHANKIVHRDIKAANVLLNVAQDRLWILDLGVCKFESQPEDPGTWGRVGADKYSCPSKWEHPSIAMPSQDVFSAGVLAYQMLTGEVPWYAKPGDSGDLLDIMKNRRPEPLTRFNVPLPVATLIHDLLNLHDEFRPSAGSARVSLEEYSAQDQVPDLDRYVYRTYRPRCPRVYRDCLHGDIRLTEFEWSVINTPEFQRLGYIRQLGTTHYVYRGATHSRFAHSLGSLHMAETILVAAEEVFGDRVAEEERLQTRAYALLHDILHIPFGHTLEDELGLFTRHDRNWDRAARMLGSKSQIARVLRGTDFGRAVLRDLTDETPSAMRDMFIREVVDSPFGADVLDYVDRDCLFCGLDHRTDSALLRRVRIARGQPGPNHFVISLAGRHGARIDAASALRSLFEARYELYTKVYAHRVKVCAGSMIGKAVALACAPGRQGGSPDVSEVSVEVSTDDQLLQSLMNAGRKQVRYLAERVWARDCYSPAFSASLVRSDYLTQDTPPDPQVEEIAKRLAERLGYDATCPAGRARLEADILKEAKVKNVDIICHLPPRPPGYRRLGRTLFDTGVDVVPSPDVSTMLADVRLRHKRLWKLHVFCSSREQATLAAIGRATQVVTGLESELPFHDRRGQRRLF